MDSDKYSLIFTNRFDALLFSSGLRQPTLMDSIWHPLGVGIGIADFRSPSGPYASEGLSR